MMLETSRRRITLLSLIFLVKNKQNKKVFGTQKYVKEHNFVRQREFKSDNYIAGTPDISCRKRLTLTKEVASQAGNSDVSSISGRVSLFQALDQCGQAKQASE